jgi:hypothetical protein
MDVIPHKASILPKLLVQAFIDKGIHKGTGIPFGRFPMNTRTFSTLDSA